MNAPIRPSEAVSALHADQQTAANRLRFVHLRVHSAYSLLEGALPIPALAKIAETQGAPALALTDTNNLFGALEFSEKLAKSGVQPIVGVTLAVDFEGDGQDDPLSNGRQPRSGESEHQRLARDGYVALLAACEAGYRNLMKIVSAAHLTVEDGASPHVSVSRLEAHAEGLIALTGGPDGPIDRAIGDQRAVVAEARLRRLHAAYADRLYVEIQRHGGERERQVEPQLIDLAYALELPLVATNEVFFPAASDYEAHDALICIAEGRYVVEDNRRRLTRQHYFKSADEMAEVFADLPEALANTVEIARRCHYRPLTREPILPRFVKSLDGKSDGDLIEEEAGELKRQAEEGLAQRLEVHGPAQGFTTEDYEKRLAYEVDVITNMKFPGYFLIVADFIKWSKAQGIPVGPGRGSGAGSLVAYALTITDLDPLRFGLLFERFLNPERVSMPDFDIDFCQDRREETIRYVQQKYGHDRVAQIITHGKLQARAVLRDVGRVLQMPYGQVDKLCKMVPNNPASPVTLPEAIESEPKLQEAQKADPLVAKLLEISIKLEGLYRHASTHAAGMVIGDRPLEDLVPLYRDPKSDMPVTQFNWKLVEAAGLVKFDFLGLKTLTVLKKAVDLVKRVRGIDVELEKLDVFDKKSYELLARADTVGVFQLESTGMRESLKRLRPDRFEDIIAMVALYRPGPMDNIPTYINRKHGEEPVDCLHPMLEGILSETYGVIIYQEQVIQIAQVMGGYTLGQADMLRRAMGKKDKAEMARHEARFIEGAVARGVKKKDAAFIFELVNKFAGYGFNKSHAAAYALVSYHTAYMKANYLEEFIAASMSLDMANTDKLAGFVAEAKKFGVPVLPPCVNASEVDFTVERQSPSPRKSRDGQTLEPPANAKAAAHPPISAPHPDPLPMKDGQKGPVKGAIRYSLAALKNVGTGAVQTIVDARAEGGEFKTLGDFASRLNAKALNKRAIETLAQSGAFDALEPSRATAKANAEQIIALAQRVSADAADGTSDLFAAPGSAPSLILKKAKTWTPLEQLEAEFGAVGFYLSGHPLDSYGKVLGKVGGTTYAKMESYTARAGAAAGKIGAIVVSVRERRSAKGNKFAFAMFSDATGQFEAVLFSDTLSAAGDLLTAGTPVVLTVSAERDEEGSIKMRVQSVESLDKVAANVERGLRLVCDPDAMSAREKLFAAMKEYLVAPIAGTRGGDVHLVLPLKTRGRELELKLPGRYDVSPNMAGRLATVPGIVEVEEI
ncbi:MAG: DNA polymerase III subunit alpha [Alphaproteobacteria bacterium]|nr:DNA polymerase III subunit alpha [Alphaproteobacteria bacterium]